MPYRWQRELCLVSSLTENLSQLNRPISVHRDMCYCTVLKLKAFNRLGLLCSITTFQCHKIYSIIDYIYCYFFAMLCFSTLISSGKGALTHNHPHTSRVLQISGSKKIKFLNVPCSALDVIHPRNQFSFVKLTTFCSIIFWATKCHESRYDDVPIPLFW